MFALRPVSVGLILVLLAALGIQSTQLATPVDNLLLDRQFRLLRQFAPDPLSQDVVIIGIDEKTYTTLPEPFSLWHPYLGNLLRGLAKAKPAVVGFDIVLPVRSYNFLIPQYDVSLLQGIMEIKKVSPLVLGQSLDENRNFRPIFPPYVAVAGHDALASVSTCVDDDGVARRYYRTLCAEGSVVKTLAGSMAQHLGVSQSKEGLIDYAVGTPLNYISLADVLTWIAQDDTARMQERFGGKAILLGAVLPFEDRHRLPVPLAAWEPERTLLPGVLIHAQTLRSMLKHGMVQPASQGLLWLFSAISVLFWLHKGSRWKLLLFIFSLPAIFALTMLMLWHGTYIPTFSLMLCAAFAFFARVAFEAVQNYREKQQMRAAFSGYVSAQVLKEILSGKIRPGLSGERLHAAVLFADIRGFTARSAAMTPERTITLLNEYFSQMTEAIQQNEGMVDKFMGDGIMASFGAPQALPNASRCALEAAQEMLVRLQRLNLRLVEQGQEAIVIGIGIHAGDVLAGNVGSISRHEYTLIGDVVNIAAQLENATKKFDFPVICSSTVAAAVGGAGNLHDLGEHSIQGHSTIHIFGWLPPTLSTTAN